MLNLGVSDRGCRLRGRSARTVTLKTRLYELVSEFCNLSKMCYLSMLHGIIPLQKKWTCEVSIKFCRLVMSANDDREI